MKVLLADDDRTVIEGLRRLIDWERLDADLVGTAENGKEALEIAIANNPDVIITDISMPVMDGLELSRQIRERIEDVYIFLITCHEDFSYARQAIQYGVNQYIIKPINPEILKELVSELQKIKKELDVKKDYYLNFWNQKEEKKVMLSLKQQDFDFFDQLFLETSQRCDIAPEHTTTLCLKLLRILYQYFESIQMDPNATERSRKNSLEEMLAMRNWNDKLNFTFQKFFDVLENMRRVKGANSDSIAVSARQKVEESFSDPDFNVAKLSDCLNCTPGYLSVVFRQSMGVNLSTYIMELRMNFAKSLLTDLNYSISDVSRIVGFANSHYFATTFKKKTSFTPSEFRNLAIQGGGTACPQPIAE